MTHRVTLFDYEAGNLHSLAKALAEPGIEVLIQTDPRQIIDTDLLVLPGVGNFTQAAERLAGGRRALRDALDAGLPALGICLGMQLLFNESDEGPGAGLGLIPGRVTRLRAERAPQIGWNTIDERRDTLFQRVPLSIAYFANSYVCRPATDDCVIAWTRHETDRFPAAVRAGPRGNVVGVQFHPEKSSAMGVAFIKAVLSDAGIGAAAPLLTADAERR